MLSNESKMWLRMRIGKDLYDLILNSLESYGLEHADFILKESPKILEELIKPFLIKNDVDQKCPDVATQ
jgi:hypothetical protein